ncbi:hypothetical protein MYCO108962_13185 [Mycobacterium colombiense]|uniref:hypothetical protein n=1 Tax=Mycobacterium colombiense TaxID=339268 RepID=UPI001EE67D6F|nr:hypothetical protein [Mycobacterium colombiense]
MAAVAGVPGASALLTWPTDHLTEAATHWETVAERSYALSHQVWRDAASVDWRGDGAAALRVATHADMETTSSAADQLQAAARVARNGASDLYAARSRVRYAIQDAQAAGYQVGEDLSVTDRMSGGSTAQRAARQAQAQALAGDIRWRAAQLVALDQQVASKITAAVAGIGDNFPQRPALDRPPKDSHVHTVDNHTFKDDPAPQPWQPPPPPYPQGKPVGPGLPPEGLRPPVDGPVTVGPASKPSIEAKGGQSLWDKNGGEWRYDPGQDRYHYPHWDYNPHNAPNSRWGNVGINGLPTHTQAAAPPRSGTVGTPPVVPQPPTPAPKPPAPKLSEGPMIGGGPSFGPQVVPPTHAHQHWLGETNIEEWEEGPAGSH